MYYIFDSSVFLEHFPSLSRTSGFFWQFADFLLDLAQTYFFSVEDIRVFTGKAVEKRQKAQSFHDKNFLGGCAQLEVICFVQWNRCL